LNNYTFIIEISKELDKKDENGNKLNYLELTQKMNDVIEKWVKDDPYQWFFLHKRWG
jgi:KDO2-lipid IV(A) lauroyltransferase